MAFCKRIEICIRSEIKEVSIEDSWLVLVDLLVEADELGVLRSQYSVGRDHECWVPDEISQDSVLGKDRLHWCISRFLGPLEVGSDQEVNDKEGLRDACEEAQVLLPSYVDAVELGNSRKWNSCTDSREAKQKQITDPYCHPGPLVEIISRESIDPVLPCHEVVCNWESDLDHSKSCIFQGRWYTILN